MAAAIVSWLGWVFMAGCAAYLMWFEPPFVTYTNLPFPVITPRVVAGHAVLLDVGRCSSDHEKRTYVVTHDLVASRPGIATVMLQSGEATVRPGCTVQPSGVTIIPRETAPGIYHIEGTGEQRLTWRRVSIPWRSADFEVVAP